MTDIWEFIKNTQPHHLTIADFENMIVGDKIEVVNWGGYFDDLIGRTYKPNECVSPPSKFYRVFTT